MGCVSVVEFPRGRDERQVAAVRRRRRVRAVAGVAVGTVLALSVATGASAKTIVGTPGPDRLTATSPGGDVLVGGGGADTLIGGPGNDQIYGVRSNNVIRAGAGSNYVEGGTGDDTVTAGDGANTIYTGSGHDNIAVGNGNNYIDVGTSNDKVVAGNGNNVLHTGSGGGSYTLGNGNNTVFYGSGPAEIKLGGGVNIVYINTSSAAHSVDCGGNPQSVLYINPRTSKGGAANFGAIQRGQIRNCPTIIAQQAQHDPKEGVTRIKRGYAKFRLKGTPDRDDKLLGSHGSGTIVGGNGNNILWADHLKAGGDKRARKSTTTITSGNGNNQVFGGRGTNIISVGNGDNVIRAGEGNNTITTGSGHNVIRLQGRGRNTVTLRGGSSYVESFAKGPKPRIRCTKGAKGIVVYGRVKPRTNCKIRASAYSKRGAQYQVKGIVHIEDAPSAFEGRPKPGDNGIGVPRPPLV